MTESTVRYSLHVVVGECVHVLIRYSPSGVARERVLILGSLSNIVRDLCLSRRMTHDTVFIRVTTTN